MRSFFQHKVPGPKGLPLLQNTLDLWTKNPLTQASKRHHQYGDMVRTQVAKHDVLLVNDPIGIRHVLQRNHKNYTKGPSYSVLRLVVGEGLLTSEGHFWLRQRKLAQPSFHRRYLEKFSQIMLRRGDQKLKEWKPFSELNFAEEMMKLTFGIVGEALFSTDIDGVAQDIGEVITEALTLFDKFLGIAMLLPSSLLERVPLPGAKKIIERLNQLVFHIITVRRKNPKAHDDLLGTLMTACDEKGSPMSDQQLKDEVMTLILAGHETTANALTWTFSLLSQHPAIETKLVNELNEILDGQEASLQLLEKLPILEQVVRESLRLYPPAWMFIRQAREEDEIAGFPVRAGSSIQICPWTLHRHPKYWEDPERFFPERFSPTQSSKQHPWTYLPFGAGPRVCIGEGFALLEAKLLLATILPKIRLVPLNAGLPEAHASVTLRPKNGWKVRILPR